MKKVLFSLGIIFSTLLLSAQAPGGMPGNGAQRQAAPSIGHIYGKLVDSTGKGIGDASVLLLQS
ncbi:MAG: hypothetical protein ICV65_14270, partial [Flavisolibacter sp.]|nr:hypothetical protein [Flavisolibacter sp.]